MPRKTWKKTFSSLQKDLLRFKQKRPSTESKLKKENAGLKPEEVLVENDREPQEELQENVAKAQDPSSDNDLIMMWKSPEKYQQELSPEHLEEDEQDLALSKQQRKHQELWEKELHTKKEKHSDVSSVDHDDHILQDISNFKAKLLNIIEESDLNQTKKWNETIELRLVELEENNCQLLEKFSDFEWKSSSSELPKDAELLDIMLTNKKLADQLETKCSSVRELQSKYAVMRKAFSVKDLERGDVVNDFELLKVILKSTKEELDINQLLAKVWFQARLLQALQKKSDWTQSSDKKDETRSTLAESSNEAMNYKVRVSLNCELRALEYLKVIEKLLKSTEGMWLAKRQQGEEKITLINESGNDIREQIKTDYVDIKKLKSSHALEVEDLWLEIRSCRKAEEVLRESLEQSKEQIRQLEQDSLTCNKQNWRYASTTESESEQLDDKITVPKPDGESSFHDDLKDLKEKYKAKSERLKAVMKVNRSLRNQMRQIKKNINLQVKGLSMKEEEMKNRLALMEIKYSKRLMRINYGVQKYIKKRTENQREEEAIKRPSSLPFNRESEALPVVKPVRLFFNGLALKSRSSIDLLRKEISGLRGELKSFALYSLAKFTELFKVLVGSPEFSIQSLKSELQLARESLNLEASVRRKLMDEIQKMKGSIRVFCRVRPLLEAEKKKGIAFAVDFHSHDTLTVFSGDAGSDGVGLRSHTFCFDRCFDAHKTQAEIFQDLEGGVMGVIDGFRICIFAYGMTGSGKTYTIEGPRNNPGILGRSVEMLFRYLTEHSGEFDYKAHISLLEIYNDELRDLLFDEDTEKQRLKISTQKYGTTVTNLTKSPVFSVSETLKILQKGSQARVVGATLANEHSSRSHMIVTLHLSKTSRLTQTTTKGMLNLIDLAGNERLKDSNAAGEALVETLHINRSLAALGDVMTALAKGNEHVPYRNSKLTQLLQTSLENSYIYMFVNISPVAAHTRETFQTLQFAKRVKDISVGQVMSHQLSKTHCKNTKRLLQEKKTVTKLVEQLRLAKNKNNSLSKVLTTSRKDAKNELEVAKKKAKALNELVRVQSDAYLSQSRSVERNSQLNKDNASWKILHEAIEKKYALKVNEANFAIARCKTLEIRLSDLRHRARIARRDNSSRQKKSEQNSEDDLVRVQGLLDLERTLRRQQSGKGKKTLRKLERQITSLRKDNASLRSHNHRDLDNRGSLSILLSPKKQSKNFLASPSRSKSPSSGKKEGIQRKRELQSQAGTPYSSPSTSRGQIRTPNSSLNDAVSGYEDIASKASQPATPKVKTADEIPNFDSSPLVMDSIDEFDVSSPSLQPLSPRNRKGIIINPLSVRSAPAKLSTYRKSPFNFLTPSRTSSKNASSSRSSALRKTPIRSSSKRSAASLLMSTPLRYDTPKTNISGRSLSSVVLSSSSPKSRKKRSNDAIRRHIQRTRKAKLKKVKKILRTR